MRHRPGHGVHRGRQLPHRTPGRRIRRVNQRAINPIPHPVGPPDPSSEELSPFFGLEIIDRVAHAHRVTPEEITGGSRKRRIVHARWEAAYLMRKAEMSYPRIAKRLNMKDHTSVIYQVRKWEKILDQRTQWQT